jgi:Sec-independent protein translocase protein TatA
MNIGGVGGLELLVILVLALLVLGPARLASSARTLGKLAREVRRGTEGIPNLLEEIQGEVTGGASPEQRTAKDVEASPPPDTQPRQPRANPAPEAPPDPKSDRELRE